MKLVLGVEYDSLFSIPSNLASCNVALVPVLVLDNWLEDLRSHDLDSFRGEELERLRDSHRRDTLVLGIAKVWHQQHLGKFVVGQMFLRVKANDMLRSVQSRGLQGDDIGSDHSHCVGSFV
jgi:hypothetical protein